MDWTGILIGGAAAGVAMYVWYSIAWLALPHHDADFRRLGDRSGIETEIEKLGLAPGMYPVPHMDDFDQGMKDPALAERMQRGPNALLLVTSKGPPMSGATLLRGFVINLGEGLMCAALFALCIGAIPDLGDKLLLGAGVGVFCGLVYATMSNWMFLSWRFAAMSAIDRIVAFSLAGLVLHLAGPGGPAG